MTLHVTHPPVIGRGLIAISPSGCLYRFANFLGGLVRAENGVEFADGQGLVELETRPPKRTGKGLCVDDPCRL
jgi:hypothetical protein